METKDFQKLIDAKAEREARRAINDFGNELGEALAKLLCRTYRPYSNPLTGDKLAMACVNVVARGAYYKEWPPEILEIWKTKVAEEVFSIIEPIKALFESVLEDKEE